MNTFQFDELMKELRKIRNCLAANDQPQEKDDRVPDGSEIVELNDLDFPSDISKWTRKQANAFMSGSFESISSQLVGIINGFAFELELRRFDKIPREPSDNEHAAQAELVILLDMFRKLSVNEDKNYLGWPMVQKLTAFQNAIPEHIYGTGVHDYLPKHLPLAISMLEDQVSRLIDIAKNF